MEDMRKPLRSKICWFPPSPGWISISYDGIVSVAGRIVGCGGVLRYERGRFLVAFAHKLGACSIVQAELWAIYHGVCLAWRRGFKQLHIESDS